MDDGMYVTGLHHSNSLIKGLRTPHQSQMREHMARSLNAMLNVTFLQGDFNMLP